MSPEQLKVLTLLCSALLLSGFGFWLGGKTTRAVAFAMIGCWLAVASDELIGGPNMAFSLAADMLYAIATVVIAVRSRALWPMYLIALEAFAMIVVFVLLALTNSPPLLQEVCYITVIMSGPAYVFYRGLLERLGGSQSRRGALMGLVYDAR